MCKYPQSQEEANRLPSAGATGGDEPSNMGARNRTWDSSVGVAYILNHPAISPAAFSGNQCCALKD